MPIFTWVLIHEKPLRAVEVGAYIHRVLILYGCLLSQVYGILYALMMHASRQAGRQAVKESYAHAAVGTCKQASRLQRCSDGSMQASKQAGVVE